MGRLNYRYQKEQEEGPLSASSGSTLLFERRVLTFVTALLGLGLVSWLTAISTDYWVVVVAGYNGTVVGNKTFLWSHSGLWRQCDIFSFLTKNEPTGAPHISHCSYHSLNHTEKNLVPTELAFVIIVLLLISLSCAFSIYSLYHPRYMFKRVAGGLHLLTAIMMIVLIEMVKSEGHPWQHHEEFESLRLEVAEDVRHYYGYSYLMAWITFIISILASLAFFAWSKKRKHSCHDLETQLK